jgi:hypothetical protein
VASNSVQKMGLLMSSDSPALLFLALIDESGVAFYEQRLSKEMLDEQLINSLSSIAFGFRNTIDLQLSSINYLGYTIYFRQASNFMAVLLATSHPETEQLINRFLENLQEKSIFEAFIELAQHNLVGELEEIEREINKIVYNLDFLNDMSKLKRRSV